MILDSLLSLSLSMISAAVVVHGGAVRVLSVAVVVGYFVRGWRMVVQLVVVGAMPIYVVRVVVACWPGAEVLQWVSKLAETK